MPSAAFTKEVLRTLSRQQMWESVAFFGRVRQSHTFQEVRNQVWQGITGAQSQVGHGPAFASSSTAATAPTPFATFPSAFRLELSALLNRLEAALAALAAAEEELEEAQSAAWEAATAFQRAEEGGYHGTALQPYQAAKTAANARWTAARKAVRDAKATVERERGRMHTAEDTIFERYNKNK